MNTLVTVPATYDYRLVGLSVIIAIFAAYTALDMAGPVTATRGVSRLKWLIGGATAMGTGIWSMHYTGMLAFRLPRPRGVLGGTEPVVPQRFKEGVGHQSARSRADSSLASGSGQPGYSGGVPPKAGQCAW